MTSPVTCNNTVSGNLRAPRTEDGYLVAAAVGGDPAAFEVLVLRYKGAVFAFIRRMTVNSDDVEDLAQQTFMKAFMNLSRFQARCSFSTWLMSIAMNEARMWKRRIRRVREVPILYTSANEVEVHSLDFHDVKPDPELTYSRKERYGRLHAGIATLPPVTRAAIQLCDLNEKSTRDTARLLGLTVAAVKSRRSRSRADLRRKLKTKQTPAPFP